MIKVIVKLSVTFERFISATLAYTLFLDLSKPPKSIKSPTGGLALSFPLSVKPLLAPKSCSLIALSNASVLRNFQSISVCLDRHYKIVTQLQLHVVKKFQTNLLLRGLPP